ncbi:MAG: helix-turn-helix domain-containing protein [Rhodomicrobium sp.]
MPAKTQSQKPRIEARALRIKDAAQAYGISRSLIYKMMGDGRLRTVKIGRRRLIPVAAIEALLEGETR